MKIKINLANWLLFLVWQVGISAMFYKNSAKILLAEGRVRLKLEQLHQEIWENLIKFPDTQ